MYLSTKIFTQSKPEKQIEKRKYAQSEYTLLIGMKVRHPTNQNVVDFYPIHLNTYIKTAS